MERRFFDRLASGSDRQRLVHGVLERARVLELLAPASPEVVSSHCVGLDLADSDIDVACHLESLDRGLRWLQSLFRDRERFRQEQSRDSVVVAFEAEGFEIEVFGQSVPVEEQRGYRHLKLHARLLALGGETLRQEVLRLKRSGVATEPAMAKALGLEFEDPFERLLELEVLSDRQLAAKFEWQ